MELTLIISAGILLGCLIALSWFAGSDAPYVPTKMDQIRKILKLAGVKKGKKFYELGSGDGRVVIEAARLGANAVGIEQSWIRVLYSRWKAKQLASPILSGNVKFIHGNLFHYLSFPRKWESINHADIVYIFLLQRAVNRLEEKLKKELKKRSIAITQTFHFKNWKPYKKILVNDKKSPNTLLGKNKYGGEFWFYKV